MSPEPVFQMHLVLGYVAWLLFFRVYALPFPYRALPLQTLFGEVLGR